MRVEKTEYGSQRWFIEDNHAAAFVHINRNQLLYSEGSKVIYKSIYFEKGTCEVRMGNNTLIIQEGSSLQVPLDTSIYIEAKFGDVDLIKISSYKNME